MSSKSLVLVTGGTGHLGLTLTMELKKRGYDVRATVRDIANEARNAPLKELDVDIVEADLLKPDTLTRAMEGVEGVFQVAAVFKLSAKDPQKEIIDPAVKGGMNVLRAAHAAKVKRVVFTSSMAAVGLNTTPDKPLTDKNWNDQDKNPYNYAKNLAERKAWEFAGNVGLDLVTITPPIIIGPYFYRHTPSTELFEDLAQNKIPAMPPLKMNFVDVRDVALAHVLAYEKENAKGRYPCATELISIKEMFEKIHAELPEIKVPKFQMPKFMFHTYALFSRSIRRKDAKLMSGMAQYIDTTKIRTELGWNPRPVEETLKDTVEWVKSVFLNKK